MEHYEEVLKILHDKFDWKLTDSLTTTGKKLVSDTIKALKIAENNQALQLQQTGVSGSVLKGFDLVKECAKLIVETQNGSVSLLQRRLDLSYNKASRIMDVLEEIKIVDQFSGEKKREVFIKNLEDLIPKLDEINVYNCRFI